MKRLESHLLLLVSFALGGVLTATLATGTAQSAVASLVEIVNTPVPTQVVNTSGTPVPTQVVNTSGTPVPTQDTDERARQPVTITTNVTVLANAENGFNFGIYTVPAAKRLVIEYVTAAGPFTDPEEMFSLSLNIEGGSAPLLYIPVTVSGGLAPNPSAHRMFASQADVMYANPGDILDAGVHTNAGSVGDSAGVFFTIYGHLVNLP